MYAISFQYRYTLNQFIKFCKHNNTNTGDYKTTKLYKEYTYKDNYYKNKEYDHIS